MEGLTTYYFLVCKDPGVNMLPQGEAGGPRVGVGPGSTHPAGATSQLPPPGPETCDLMDTPASPA